MVKDERYKGRKNGALLASEITQRFLGTLKHQQGFAIHSTFFSVKYFEYLYCTEGPAQIRLQQKHPSILAAAHDLHHKSLKPTVSHTWLYIEMLE
jgi:hypothetical protein